MSIKNTNSEDLLIAGYKFSVHAIERKNLRKLEVDEIENVINYGREFQTGNGRKVFFLGEKEVRNNKLPDSHKNSAIVVSANRKKIITCIKDAEIKNLKKYKKE